MRLGIRVKLLLFAAAVLTVIFGIYSAHIYSERTEQTRRMALTTASLLAREVMADRKIYASMVVRQALDSGLPVKSAVHPDEVGIPTPSAFFKEVAAMTKTKGGFSMALTSASPINPASAPADAFQRAGLEALSNGAESSYHAFEEYRGRQSLRYMVADVAVSQTCVDCHNANPSSAKRDYKIGDVMGAIEITMPIDAEMALAVSDIWRSLAYGFAVIVVMGLAGLAFVRATVTGPLFSLTETVGRVADGDLTASTGETRNDEIGDFGRRIDEVIANLNKMIEEIRRASDESLDISGRVKEMSKTVLDGSNRQGAALDSISTSMDGINRSVAELGKDSSALASTAARWAASASALKGAASDAAADAEAVGKGADEAASHAGRAAASARELRDGVEALSSAAVSASSALVRMGARVREIETNASEARAAAEEVAMDSAAAAESVGAAVRGVAKVGGATAEADSIVNGLNDRIREIGKILDMIMEVAEETNLLAVNAAIIAAQSGEHGKSFSIVAGEIKDLAERTTSSAKEVTDIIRAAEAESGRAAEAMARGAESAREGARLASSAEEDLRGITAGARRSADGTREIARVAAEQAVDGKAAADAIDAATDSTRRVAGASQEQAAESELASKAAERIKAGASAMRAAAGAQVEAGGQLASVIEDVNLTAAHINGVLREETRAIQRIVEALAAVRKVSMQNIDTTVNTDAAVEEMVRLNEAISGGVKRFKLKR